MTDNERLEAIADDKVPALTALLGDELPDILNVALAPAGARCESARVSQIRYVPSESVTAQCEAKVKWDSGSTTTETLVTMSGLPLPKNTPVVEAEGFSVAVWRYPNDPFLPGLAAGADPERVRRLLASLGAPADEVRLRRRAYRPARRAVIEAITPRARIFLKIVRPRNVASLQEKHTAMSDHVPVPHSYGWSEELGLIALQAMPGKTLRKAIETGTRRLPAWQQLVALLASLHEPSGDPARVSGPAAQVSRHAALLTAVAPALAERINGVAGAVQAVTAGPAAPVHGDFHSSQVIVKGTEVVGLLDVDTAGTGQRADDLAGVLGHLATLGLMSRRRKTFNRYGADLISGFDSQSDPRDLRLRTAAVVLGLATGPFRVQQPGWLAETERRVALAESWIESASALP